MYFPMKGLTTPPDHEVIWRYLDLPKLASMLHKRSLHFTRLDALEDKFEGMMPRAVVQAERKYDREVKRGRALVGRTATKAPSSKAGRKAAAVSCWHRSEHESMAMWKTYGPVEFGVAIRSSVGGLKTAFSAVPAERRIFIAQVTYLDFEADMPIDAWLTVLNRVFWKQKAFESERELRCAVFQGQHGHGGGFHVLGKGGLDLAVNLDVLVDEIVVSPAAAPWYVETVRAVVEGFGVGADKVRPSKLSVDPRKY